MMMYSHSKRISMIKHMSAIPPAAKQAAAKKGEDAPLG